MKTHYWKWSSNGIYCNFPIISSWAYLGFCSNFWAYFRVGLFSDGLTFVFFFRPKWLRCYIHFNPFFYTEPIIQPIISPWVYFRMGLFSEVFLFIEFLGLFLGGHIFGWAYYREITRIKMLLWNQNMIVHFYKFAAKSVQKWNFRKNEIFTSILIKYRFRNCKIKYNFWFFYKTIFVILLIFNGIFAIKIFFINYICNFTHF